MNMDLYFLQISEKSAIKVLGLILLTTVWIIWHFTVEKAERDARINDRLMSKKQNPALKTPAKAAVKHKSDEPFIILILAACMGALFNMVERIANANWSVGDGTGDGDSWWGDGGDGGGDGGGGD